MTWKRTGAGHLGHRDTAGVLGPAKPDQPVHLDTVFDIARLGNILAVWSSIGTLVEDGTLQLDARRGIFWPEVEGHPER